MEGLARYVTASEHRLWDLREHFSARNGSLDPILYGWDLRSIL
jgi:hypothetical protein